MIKVMVKVDRVRVILARKNREQNWLAERCQITKQYLWQILEGKRNPSEEMRTRMLRALGLNRVENGWDEIFLITSFDDRRSHKQRRTEDGGQT